jgi:chromate reductase, NAD(P)H dehydrogenase (quinone)
VTLDMPAVNQPQVLIANAAQKFDAEGNLTDEGAKTLIEQLLQKLVVWTRKLQAS